MNRWIIAIILVLVVTVAYQQVLLRVDSSVGQNAVANGYCKGKGFDQGFEDAGKAVCQTITTRQQIFDL